MCQVGQRQCLRSNVAARIHVVQERTAALPNRHLLRTVGRKVFMISVRLGSSKAERFSG